MLQDWGQSVHVTAFRTDDLLERFVGKKNFKKSGCLQGCETGTQIIVKE